jgi:hypothetical protein
MTRTVGFSGLFHRVPGVQLITSAVHVIQQRPEREVIQSLGRMRGDSVPGKKCKLRLKRKKGASRKEKTIDVELMGRQAARAGGVKQRGVRWDVVGGGCRDDDAGQPKPRQAYPCSELSSYE